jgi:hypothetical protein
VLRGSKILGGQLFHEARALEWLDDNRCGEPVCADELLMFVATALVGRHADVSGGGDKKTRNGRC